MEEFDTLYASAESLVVAIGGFNLCVMTQSYSFLDEYFDKLTDAMNDFDDRLEYELGNLKYGHWFTLKEGAWNEYYKGVETALNKYKITGDDIAIRQMITPLMVNTEKAIYKVRYTAGFIAGMASVV